MMKYGLIFRRLKNTKYSFVPLYASLEKTSLLKDIDILPIRQIKELAAYDGKYQELIIAFSFMTFNLEQIVKDLTDIKAMGLKTPYSTIAGGPHISGDPASGEVMGFDSIFIGDGEATIRQYCQDLLLGQRKKIYDGRIDPIDLDDYPPFATEKFRMVIPIEITRGCPFGCKYCAVSYIYGTKGRKPRYRSIDQILEYTRWQTKNKKTISRFISPNAFGYLSPNGVEPNIEALGTLLEGVQATGVTSLYLGTFPSEVRPESVTPEVLDLVKEYCDNDSLVIGVQSGSERMLQVMGRGHSLKRAEDAIHLVKEYGFTPMVDFIFGLPGERESDRKATITWMDRISQRYGAMIHAHTFLPLVGSPWANTNPEPLDTQIIKVLGRYSQEQKLYGQWSKQQVLAEKIKQWRANGLISHAKHDLSPD